MATTARDLSGPDIASPHGSPAPWAVPLALGTVWLTMGGNYLGFKVAVETIPPFLMIAVRLLAAGAVMLALAVALDRRLRHQTSGSRVQWPTGKQLRSTAIMGIMLLVIGQGALVWGIRRLPAGTAAVLTSSLPLWLALFRVIFQHKRLRRRELLGLAFGFAGLVLLSGVLGSGLGDRLDPAAVAAVLAGAASAAAGVLYGHDADLPDSAFLGTALQMLIAGLALAAGSLALGELAGFAPEEVSDRSALALLYLIVAGSIIGFGAFVWLTRAASATTVSTFAYVGPVVALGLSAWLLDEALTATKIIAAALAVTGAALMVGKDQGEPPCPSKFRPCNQ